MATIKYTGLANFRQLLVEDFKKWGVEIREALTFGRHEATEVHDDVADAVMANLPEEFQKVQAEVKDETIKVVEAAPTINIPGQRTAEATPPTSAPVQGTDGAPQASE